MAADDKPIDPTLFWRHVQSGLLVAVASSGRLPEKMLGVRDGFRRYFDEGLGVPIRVTVTPRLDPREESDAELPLEDDEILRLARDRARAVAEVLAAEASTDEGPDFVVGTEAGLLSIDQGDVLRHGVRTWTVVRTADGSEAWGSSGTIQLPQRLIDELDLSSGGSSGKSFEGPRTTPGTRRGGGLVRALTCGLETRREATAQATVNALSSLLYGLIEPTRLG